MKVKLLTPQGLMFSGDATDVLLQADKGQMNILERHADIIARMAPGDLLIRGAGSEKKFKVSAGFVRVKSDECSILSMTADIL